ncbi:MAG: hypothetical protein DRG83_11790 [Deltaproteobacteria bacterium]|nr:MAG: hypothetical protein DRG83_11790 [Deltaproteobacteria bacterium]
MRILFVVQGLPPQSTGGTELYTYYLARELHRRHEVYIFCRRADPSQEEYAVQSYLLDGLPVTSVNNSFRKVFDFSMTYKNDIIAGIFARFLEQVQPDIVHIQHLIGLSTSLISICSDKNIPVLLTLHDYWFLCQRGQLLKPDLTICSGPRDWKCAMCLWSQIKAFLTQQSTAVKRRTYLGKIPMALRRWCVQLNRWKAIEVMHARTRHMREMLESVDMIFTPSRFHRDQCIKLGGRFGISPDRIRFLSNGMNVDLFANFRKKPSSTLRFGFIGTIIPSKGLHVLIKAFNRIQSNRATLRIHGIALPYDGYNNYMQDLRAMVVNPNIHFMGGYNNAQIAQILSEIDVLIVPSIWYENAPLTIHEAFIAKIPVIASNIGGMAELVHHMENGLLFEVGNSDDLYVKIQTFIENPSLVEALSGNIKPVKTIEENAKELEAIYNELIAR